MDGYPKAVAQALPKQVHEGSFEDLVEAVSVKLKEDYAAKGLSGLHTAMEIAQKKLAFQMMNIMAQRCERSKRMAEAMREQVSIMPLQMLVDALRNEYDLNDNVKEIDPDRNKRIYDDQATLCRSKVLSG
ncbi:unnamed protein product [Heligmosomoides polygyrus]|uniref:Focal_AT domain-containing protein n=1 Tax=Heligmosomoides polygyrus TaxID=6339 RepID=A0A183FHH9_HELPZ|nr:unnamed protein product [Heligmosomoides polygyrus]